MVVVEVRQRTLWIAGRSWTRRTTSRTTRRTTRRRRGDEERRGEERRGEEEQATDIKSNNPHLAGGEISMLKHVKQLESYYRNNT